MSSRAHNFRPNVKGSIAPARMLCYTEMAKTMPKATALEYESRVFVPRGSGEMLDYEPRGKWTCLRRWLRPWAVLLITFAAMTLLYLCLFLLRG